VVQLLEIFQRSIPKLIQDVEVSTGLGTLVRLGEEARKALEPIIGRYGESRQRGYHRAHILRKALFPPETEPSSPYEVLETLQSLHLYLSHIEGGLSVLSPASQASWDKDFVNGVKAAARSIHRMQSWTDQQMKVRSPQTLLVPVLRKDSQT
jgi:ferredoxin-nitrate reductase